MKPPDMDAAGNVQAPAAAPITSPIFVSGLSSNHQRAVFSALKDRGFPLHAGKSNEIARAVDFPVAVIDCRILSDREAWLAYAAGGGSLVAIHPGPEFAEAMGVSGSPEKLDRALLSFIPGGGADPVQIEVRARIDTCGCFPGNILAKLTPAAARGDGPGYPGMVELPFNGGRILVILFSLGEYIGFLHQRTAEIARQADGGSAERIAVSGMDKTFLRIPQLDLLMDFLSGWISRELLLSGRPVPRFALLPGGRRSMVAFSFDDVAPTGKPIRNALERLRGNGSKASRRPAVMQKLADVKAVCGQLARYPFNYREQAKNLVTMFGRYGATGSVYLLPFAAGLQNRPRITGYAGFSKRTYQMLAENGWDVGTHIKPDKLSDYKALCGAFQNRFKTAPHGHRGHELGWVGWDEDFSELERLGYAYDSTWNWGGHGGLAWVLGTAFPFHPTDRRGHPLSVLEMPVTAWLEDLYRDPERSLAAIEQAMDRYPGIYHFAGHSSLMMTSGEYAKLVEEILVMANRRRDAGTGKNIAELADFWRLRARSRIDRLAWDEDSTVLSCRIESLCEGGDLSLILPYQWGDKIIRSVLIDGRETDFFNTPSGHVFFAVGKGLQRMQAFYG